MLIIKKQISFIKITSEWHWENDEKWERTTKNLQRNYIPGFLQSIHSLGALYITETYENVKLKITFAKAGLGMRFSCVHFLTLLSSIL